MNTERKYSDKPRTLQALHAVDALVKTSHTIREIKSNLEAAGSRTGATNTFFKEAPTNNKYNEQIKAIVTAENSIIELMEGNNSKHAKPSLLNPNSDEEELIPQS